MSVVPATVPAMDDEPFLGRQAVRAGTLTAHRLKTRYRAVYRNVYLRNDIPLTADRRARAAWLWAGGSAVVVGVSAAALLGTKWLDGTVPAQLVRGDRHCPPGIAVHNWELCAGEIHMLQGMPVTTAARTAFDIGRTLPLEPAVPILDALMNATNVKPADIASLADRKSGTRGVRRLRAALERSDGGAESPQESRVRTLLVDAGLPKPQTQLEFHDHYGHAYIRVDMGWREWRVAVEYDGVQHWTDRRQRSWDIDRLATLEAMGWAVIRVSAEMLSRPRVIVERVRAKLLQSGCPL